jgi:hypothetical protein
VSERSTPHITVQEIATGKRSTFASWDDFLRFAEALDASDTAPGDGIERPEAES